MWCCILWQILCYFSVFFLFSNTSQIVEGLSDIYSVGSFVQINGMDMTKDFSGKDIMQIIVEGHRRYGLTLSQTTNFRPFQTEKPTILNLIKMAEKFSKRVENTGKRRNCSLWAISPFSLSVFKTLVLHTCKKTKNQGLFRKGLTLSQTTNFRLFQTERVCRRQF